MKRLRVAVGLIVLVAVCSLAGYFGGRFRKLTGPGDSPVVVRGGAMTVRTKSSAGWQGASAPFCTGIVLTGGALYFNYSGLDIVPGNPNPTPTPFPPPPKGSDGSLALTPNNWTLTILGRNFPVTTPAQSNNGIDITWVPSCAGASAASVYVQLSLIGAPNATFYGTDIDGSSAVVSGKRFRDRTPYVSGGTNCYGPNTSAAQVGDEDACERASLVTLSNTVGTTTTTYSGWCTNGECVIGLGDQQ
jgi:hypothetical protein